MSKKYTNRGSAWAVANSWWILATFVPIGLASFIAFLYIGFRVKNNTWRNFGFLYLGLLIIGLYIPSYDMGVRILLLSWIASIIHAFIIRSAYLVQLDVVKENEDILEQQRRQQLWQENQNRFQGAPYGQPRPQSGSGHRPPLPRNMPPLPGSIPPPSGHRSPLPGNAPPPSGHRPPLPGNVPPPSGNMPPLPGNVPPSSGNMPPLPGGVPPLSGNMPPLGVTSPSPSGNMPPTVRAPLDGKIIDINTASEAQIASITEIGIVLAKRVVIKRQELGGFRSFEQFSQVMGLKEHTMRSIAQIVVFSQATSNNITQPKSGRIIDY